MNLCPDCPMRMKSKMVGTIHPVAPEPGKERRRPDGHTLALTARALASTSPAHSPGTLGITKQQIQTPRFATSPTAEPAAQRQATTGNASEIPGTARFPLWTATHPIDIQTGVPPAPAPPRKLPPPSVGPSDVDRWGRPPTGSHTMPIDVPRRRPGETMFVS